MMTDSNLDLNNIDLFKRKLYGKFYDFLYFLGKCFLREHRGYVVAGMAEIFGLIYHIFFLFYYKSLNILPMYYFNMFSVTCFCVCIFLLGQFKNVNIVFFITVFEVVIHQILADYFLGSMIGSHFLILILVVFPYLVEKEHFHVGIPTSVFCILVFFACEIVFSRTRPIYILSKNTITTIRYINIIASITVVFTLIVIFKLIISYIEYNLEHLNQKNRALLENILPKKVISNLQETGRTDPELFHNVSVMFTDIVNFTTLSMDLPPEVLISELNDIFTKFDSIMDKYNCVRIKTIGDAYLAVCGLPEPNPNHTRNIVHAALECRDYLAERNRTAAHKWTIRLGVNDGDVVAGIVGVKKYIYDVFGDAVNVASRMESNSEEMKICVSRAVYDQVKSDFHYVSRQEKEIKGRGMMEIFFIEKNAQ